VRLWNARTGELVGTVGRHDGVARAVAFSPSGTILVSGGDDRAVRLWDLGSGEELAVLGGHEGSVRALALSPGGGSLASGSLDETVRLWDLASGAPHSCIAMRSPVLALAWSGSSLAVAAMGGLAVIHVL
jgi:WD40 repeat protein